MASPPPMEAPPAADSPTPQPRVTTAAAFRRLLADAGNKMVVVQFHATWVRPCRDLVGRFDKTSLEFPDDVFASVDLDEGAEAAATADVIAVPHYQVYLRSEMRGDVIGGRYDELLELMDATRKLC